MSVKILKQLEPLFIREYGNEVGGRIVARTKVRFYQLCSENADEPKAVHRHTLGIYAAIACYESMQAEGVSKEAAVEFFNAVTAEKVGAVGDKLRGLLKLPGLYRTVPAMWKFFTPRMFGPAAGFQFHFYDVGKRRVKFDMLQCPYCDTCNKYGCPELVPIFCHSDDLCYGSMHPRLRWNRTKTLGNGGDCCDFDILVE